MLTIVLILAAAWVVCSVPAALLIGAVIAHRPAVSA